VLRLSELGGDQLREALATLAEAAGEGLLPKLAVERIDGDAVIGSALEETMVEAGFSRQPRRLVASAA
jgi:hypothetical protein